MEDTHDRIVEQSFEGAQFVNTVFEGRDLNYKGIGEPMLFKTYVYDTVNQRPVHEFEAPNWECALKDHKKAVKLAKKRNPLG